MKYFTGIFLEFFSIAILLFTIVALPDFISSGHELDILINAAIAIAVFGGGYYLAKEKS